MSQERKEIEFKFKQDAELVLLKSTLELYFALAYSIDDDAKYKLDLMIEAAYRAGICNGAAEAASCFVKPKPQRPN